MKTIYIAGPMRDHPRFNFDAFDHAARSLRAHGWEVLSPAEADIGDGFDPDNPGPIDEARYERWMKRDLEMIGRCDSIFLLRGWQNSKGARRELALALALGHTVILQED